LQHSGLSYANISSNNKGGNNMKKFAGIILLIIGSIVLLAHFGRMFLLVLIAGLVFVGAKKLKHAYTKQDKNAAYLLLGLAVICCLLIIPLLFTLLISGALMYLGWNLFKQPLRTSFSGSTVTTHSFDNSFDADWKAFVEKNKN
jgi:predicted membrane protein